eukprot:Nitzschia sp. Nitz4//scaffold23_size168460//64166//65497//NITZ4_002214-RA/size168460-processed-gene-0.220-mRNA-1//1//CDS//3329543620//3975//frame0
MPQAVDPTNLSSLYFTKSNDSNAEPYVSDLVEIRHISDKRGRGVVAKSKLSPGTCIFITPPVLKADVPTVWREWKKSPESLGAARLEEMAEQSLVDSMQQTLQDSASPAISNSFLPLVGKSTHEAQSSIPSVHRLLAKDHETPIAEEDRSISSEHLRMILRRNAFGPDFVTYSAMIRNFAQDPTFQPTRMVGLYPYAAMLNHSCHPNALRVFVGDVMVLHASTTIAAGEEIVCSYVPPIYPYPRRQSIFQQNHGFLCDCHRCQLEAPFWKDPAPPALQTIRELEPWDSTGTPQQISNAVALLEETLLPSVSNELRHFLRVGFTELYMRHLNEALTSNQTSTDDLLKLCMQLHFGFWSAHNASTEHLSILHLGYQLIGALHTRAADQSKTLPKLRFWTEQVKQACMVRYGPMGQDIDSVRRMMQHTRQVLRTKDGWVNATYTFI